MDKFSRKTSIVSSLEVIRHWCFFLDSRKNSKFPEHNFDFFLKLTHGCQQAKMCENQEAKNNIGKIRENLWKCIKTTILKPEREFWHQKFAWWQQTVTVLQKCWQNFPKSRSRKISRFSLDNVAQKRQKLFIWETLIWLISWNQPKIMDLVRKVPSNVRKVV